MLDLNQKIEILNMLYNSFQNTKLVFLQPMVKTYRNTSFLESAQVKRIQYATSELTQPNLYKATMGNAVLKPLVSTAQCLFILKSYL